MTVKSNVKEVLLAAITYAAVAVVLGYALYSKLFS